MRSAIALFVLAGAAAAASAAPITQGNLVIYRVGTGAASLTSAAQAVFVDEYTPTGTLVQSIALPTTVSGSNRRITASGTATSEGFLTVSPGGQYVTVTGYDASTGTTSVASTVASSVNRVVGVISTNTGTVSSNTTLTAFSGNNVRSAFTSNGTDIWATGAGSGVIYTTAGSSGAGTAISTTVTNLRQINAFGDQLYVSTGSGTAVRLGSVGSGLPTTSGQTTSNLPGFPTAGSPYAFVFFDLSSTVAGVDTLYVADDAAGLQKYSLVSGSWTLNGTIGAAADLYRGLTGTIVNGQVQLFATRLGGSGAAGGGQLVSLGDASGYNGAFSGTPTLLATASANTAFRGVAYVPTPGAAALVGLGLVAAGRRRR